MSLSQNPLNQFAHQLNELRDELQNHVLRMFGTTEFTKDVIEHIILTEVDMDDDFLCFNTHDLFNQVEAEIAALIEQKIIVEHWEKKTRPKKTRKKILRGLPGRNNFGAPNKIEQEMFEVELKTWIKHERKQKQYDNQPQE